MVLSIRLDKTAEGNEEPSTEQFITEEEETKEEIRDSLWALLFNFQK